MFKSYTYLKKDLSTVTKEECNIYKYVRERKKKKAFKDPWEVEG